MANDGSESLYDFAWRVHQTVLVYGKVSQAIWWPPCPELGLPGVLAAPGPDEAKALLESLIDPV